MIVFSFQFLLDQYFLHYFILSNLQEELAFIYQSITLNEDALIQYDEVDALLSQFIINCSGKGYFCLAYIF